MKGFVPFFYFLILFIVLSCKSERKKIVATKNKDIIEFRATNFLQSSQLTKLDSTTFNSLLHSDTLNKLTDTIKYTDKEIYISFLTLANGCGTYTGDILFSDDTLKLKLISTSSIVCTEENCDRVVYRIKRHDNKKYKIIKVD